MKKLVLFFAAAVAISFASCGSTTTSNEEVTPVAPEQEQVDSIADEVTGADEVAEQAPEAGQE